MGMKEICLTAHHEGGFALWPSKFTEYSVARSLHWHGGRGDVLRAFADAANRAGINICYYINTPSDGYEANVANRSAEAFTASQARPFGWFVPSFGMRHTPPHQCPAPACGRAGSACCARSCATTGP